MSNYTMPPRQKMINLIYVILIAMLGLNVSIESPNAIPDVMSSDEKEENLEKKEDSKPTDLQLDICATRENQILINGKPMDILPDGTIKNPMVLLTPKLPPTLYKGCENKLNFTSIGVSEQGLKLSMKNGKIIERNGQFAAIPDDNVQIASIDVRYGDNVLTSNEYVVKDLPTPIPYIVLDDKGKRELYKGNTPISQSKVKCITGLIATASEGPRIAYRIMSFETVFIKSDSNKVITLKNSGNKLSYEQLQVIGQLQPRDKFYVTSIIVSGGQKNNEPIASINIVLI